MPTDDLQKLWQQQPTPPLDVRRIRQDCRRQVWRQRSYLAFDLLSTVGVIVYLGYLWHDLSTLAASLVVAVMLITLPMVVMLVRLRWLAVRGFQTTTADYLALLIRQMHNNAKIARITKHSAWLSEVLLLLIFGAMFATGDLSASRQGPALISLLGVTVAMTVCYIWAHRRQQRFLQKQAELEALQREHQNGTSCGHTGD